MQVIVPDARNHGDSPHSNQLNYEVLSNDIIQLMKDLAIPKAILVGHSMGGRAMMTVALTQVNQNNELLTDFDFHNLLIDKQPSLVDRLVVVDISPVNVSPGAHSMAQFLTVMDQINLGDQLKRATARKVVDDQLQVVVKVRLNVIIVCFTHDRS